MLDICDTCSRDIVIYGAEMEKRPPQDISFFQIDVSQHSVQGVR